MSILFDIGADLEYRKRISQTETTEIQIFSSQPKVGRKDTRANPITAYSQLSSLRRSRDVTTYFYTLFLTYFKFLFFTHLSYFFVYLNIYLIHFLKHRFSFIYYSPPSTVRRSPSAIRRPFPCFTAPAMRSLANSFSYTFFYRTYKLSLFFSKK